MKSGTWLAHPDPVNGFDFGSVPTINSRGVIIPEGIIRLKHGRHFGPNRGFGAEHIWAEHAEEMSKSGFKDQSEVPAYVAKIIQTGTPIY